MNGSNISSIPPYGQLDQSGVGAKSGWIFQWRDGRALPLRLLCARSIAALSFWIFHPDPRLWPGGLSSMITSYLN
jgi:hypothetical protein